MAPHATESATSTFTPPTQKQIETRLFINNEFVPSSSGKTFDVTNPATLKLTATLQEATVEDVDAAVKAAKDAFPAWSELGAAERSGYVMKLAEAMEKKIKEISYLDAICMGKPVTADFASDMAVTLMKYYAGKSFDILGETSLNTANMVNVSFRQPYGVCGAIIPWNVPATMAAMKIAPCLIAGNTLVLKSSEKAPLSSLLIAQCAKDIGLPAGVLNVLSGYGRPCGEAMAKHMDIRKLSFTGSGPTGRAIKKAAAESNLKNVTLELGGKSPLIIFDDADLQKAIPAAAFSILMNSGQVCVASSRVYVHESIADKFLEGMKAAMTQIGGNPSDPVKEGTTRGPQADKLQFDRVMSYLTSAKTAGLEFALGGAEPVSSEDGGYFVAPTIITNAPETSNVMKEEIFGPVVCVNTFSDEADVLKRANDTEYGLYASVFTKDISRAMRIAKRFEAGSVGVNCTSPMMAVDMPFGGWKGSGEGREMSSKGLEAWTELKTVFIAL